MDTSTQSTISKIQTQIAALHDQIVLKKKLVNQLCELEEQPLIYSITELADSQTASNAAFRPDQFYGRPLATAVREILERRFAAHLGAIALNELFETLKKGGYAFDNSNDQIAKRNTAITLAKNPAFAKVPHNGHIGLAEWYPNAKKPKKDKHDSEPEGDDHGEDDNCQDAADALPTESQDHEIVTP